MGGGGWRSFPSLTSIKDFLNVLEPLEHQPSRTNLACIKGLNSFLLLPHLLYFFPKSTFPCFHLTAPHIQDLLQNNDNNKQKKPS